MNSNELEEGQKAYKVYYAIRLHFTTDYDFFQYNGKTRISDKSWYSRDDRFFFKKIERDIGLDNLVPFFVANYMDGQNLWVKKLIGVRAKRNFEFFTPEEHYNTFRGDLALLKARHEALMNDIEEGVHPNLLKYYISKEISPVTMIILQSLTKYSSSWNKVIGSDPQWSSVRSYFGKLKDFVVFDRQKCLEKYKEFFEIH